MPTRDDYERLILHSLKPGSKVRVPMKDLQEYNSQRMTFFRLLQSLKATAHDVSRISTRKVVEVDQIFLEIENLPQSSATFLLETEEGFQPIEVSRDLSTREDDAFEKWMQDARRLAKETPDNGTDNEQG